MMTDRLPLPGEPLQFFQGAQISPALAVGYFGGGMRLWVFPADGTAPRMVSGVPHSDWVASLLQANPHSAPAEMGFWDFVATDQADKMGSASHGDR